MESDLAHMNRLSMMGELAASLAHEITQRSRSQLRATMLVRPSIFRISSRQTWATSGSARFCRGRFRSNERGQRGDARLADQQRAKPNKGRRCGGARFLGRALIRNISSASSRLSTPRSPSGVGMGLAIRRSIIDAHGGRMWAGADEPRGAVFQFSLARLGREVTAAPAGR